MNDQLPLFAGVPVPQRGPVRPAEVPQGVRATAARLPPGLRLGTSSWSFPGWEGLVYDRAAKQAELAQDGLRAYAQHPLLRTVGIDRTYYAPIGADVFARYAAQVPDDFRFLAKAGEAVVRPLLPDRDNPTFLDPLYAEEQVVGPFVEGLGAKAGPLVFQFPPLDLRLLGGAAGFAARLHDFFSRLRRGPLYAVELRTRAAFGPAYLEALGAVGVVHCLNGHPSMPPVPEQAARAGAQTQRALVVRWMLARQHRYQSAKEAFAPFDRLAGEDPASREGIAAQALEALGRQAPVYVVVNNKAEGCSPLSVVKLAERIAGLLDGEGERSPPPSQ